MPSTIFSIATVAASLLATTASAKGNVAVYWGQGSNQKELSVVCSDPSVDIVNIGFVNGFPKSRNEYPKTNFGNACGGEFVNNPDGTKSGLFKSCDIIARGIKVCKQNNKKVLLSLGGGYPPDYYLPNADVYKWFADTLWGSFGPVDASYKGPRPFGDAAVDGFDLDIESTVGNLDGKSPNFKSQYYGDFVNYLKSKNSAMLISAAPQCIVPDAHLDDAISKAPFDYIFTQFYNTDSCSAKLGYQQINQQTTGFTFDKWVQRLHEKSASKNVKLYIGLSAGANGAKPEHYLKPEEADALITKYKGRDFFGGVMLWEATVSQNNTVFDQGYSNWIKYSLDGTFKDKYKPAAPAPTSTKTPTKTSTVAPSTKSTSAVVSSTTVSSKTSAAPSSYSASSSVASSSIHQDSSSVVIPSSSYHSSASSSAHVPISSSVSHSETSNVEYSSYFSTALPTDVYSTSSASVSPSIVYPDDVSSTVTHSSTPGVSTSTPAESGSTPTASDYSVYPVSSSTADHDVSSSTTPVDASSTPCTTSTELYPESSKTPEVSSTASDYSVAYPTTSTKTPDVSSSSSVGYPVSSTTPVGTSSTPCTTSTEVYPVSSKTPEASLSTSEYSFYSESSKIPEVSSKASSEYPVEYPTGHSAAPSSSKVPEYPAEYPASSASEHQVYSTATPTVTKPAESTTTVVTTTYLDTCSTGLTTKTAVITKTVCESCTKPSDKPEADYPEDWTTSVYVSKTLTVTITKPIHPATDVPAYPTGAMDSEYPAAPKPSTPAVEYPVDKAEVPSYPEVPAEKPSTSAAEYPVASSKAAIPSKPIVPSYPEDVTVTFSQYATLTKVATPVAYTHTPYATPVAYQSYPVGNGTASAVKPSGTGAVKPTSSGKPNYPTSYTPPEFEGAASQLSLGITGVVAIFAFFML